MPSILNRIYDKFIGTMKEVSDRFGLRPREEPRPLDFGLPREPDVHKMEFPLPAGLEERVELTPWSSFAYLDQKENRFRDAKTGLFIQGDEYRERQSAWREQFLGELLENRFPELTEEERTAVVMQIEDIRAGDLESDVKDAMIRALIGSP